MRLKKGGSCDEGTMQSPIDILQCIDNETIPFELRFNGHGDVRPEGFIIKNVGNTGNNCGVL
jgi:carbonic anhydrase